MHGYAALGLRLRYRRRSAPLAENDFLPRPIVGRGWRLELLLASEKPACLPPFARQKRAAFFAGELRPGSLICIAGNRRSVRGEQADAEQPGPEAAIHSRTRIDVLV